VIVLERRKLKELVINRKVSRGFLGKAPHGSEAKLAENIELAENISIKDMVDGRVDTRNLEKREIVGVKDLLKFTTREGDVLLAVKGSSFKTSLVDADSKDRIFSPNIISLRINEKMLLPEIVVAYLNSPEGKHEIDSIARGVCTTSISTNNLLELEIPVPPLKTQIALKEYLNSVDRYLEALHQEEKLINKIKDHVISSLMGVVA
jgi:restriction endonuclease S subunit